MEFRIIILCAVLIIPLAYTFDTIPTNPQTFRFGRTARPDIEESFGCFDPNRSSTKYKIKFQSDRWLLYVLCYDKNSDTPLQSSHLLAPPLSEQTLNTPHSTEKFSNNLIATPSQFYDCYSQVENFKILLGSENHARKLISCNTGNYYVPSNLVPVSDFPFQQQRMATQYYINTFPQWKQIKEGNWKNLEESIRKYANNIRSSLMIRGGTLRIATLPDSAGQEKPVYMTRNNGNVPTVSVPRLVWKLVHDHRRYESIVFVIVNNPYRTSTQDLFKNQEVVCNCVCDKTEGWFDGWNRLDFTKGYIYCCTWDEFHNNVGIRNLANTGLLRRKK